MDGTLQDVGSKMQDFANVVNAMVEFVSDIVPQFEQAVETVNMVIKAFIKLNELVLEILMDVISRIIEGIVFNVFERVVHQLKELQTEMMGFFEPMITELKNIELTNEPNFNLDQITDIDFLNPISTFNTIVDVFNSLSSIQDMYNRAIDAGIGTMSSLLDFLTSGSEGDITSGRGFAMLIVPNLLSVGYAVLRMFGVSADQQTGVLRSNTNRQQAAATKSATERELRLDLRSRNYELIFLGLINEMLSGLKEGVQGSRKIAGKNFAKETVKFLISSSKFLVTGASFGLKGVRKDTIDEINQNNQFDLLEFYRERVITNLWSAFVSWGRDFVSLAKSGENTPDLTERIVSLIKTLLYMVSAGIKMNKAALIDFPDWLGENKKAKYSFNHIGYPASILENLVKVIRNVVKWAMEFSAFIAPDDEGIKDAKSQWSSKEVVLRFKYLTPIDFIEDFANLILYDYTEFNFNAYNVPL